MRLQYEGVAMTEDMLVGWYREPRDLQDAAGIMNVFPRLQDDAMEII